jgi:tetraacyldisaccharide 4'-kinase
MSRGRLSRSFERLWYGSSPWAVLLQPLAWLYAAVVALRRALYARAWLRTRHPGVPVIVVGNITAGGTGKTPVVAWLAARLHALGRRPAIVSRGYGGTRHREPALVTASSSAADVGDEPLLLARRTGVPVIVGAGRVAAARLAVEQGADVVVADDGLQHYALARDLEIVVVDGERGFGNGRMLPAGPLREPTGRLAQAGLVLRNGGPAVPGALCFELELGEAMGLTRAERRAAAAFAGRKVWAVAGIGNPARFIAELRRRGIDAQPVEVPDHGTTDLAGLQARADWPILMTEKDAVKYPDCDLRNAWYLPVEVRMPPETEARIMGRVEEALRAPPAGG